MRFRRQIYQEAKARGFSPKSLEFEKMTRMVQADLFMLGMAVMFPFSLFDNQLAPPMNHMVEASALLFGDEKERERAFFGAYGLNTVMGPAPARLYQIFKTMLSGEWEEYSNYHAWTLLPFGRAAKDSWGLASGQKELIPTVTGAPKSWQIAKAFKEEGSGRL